MNKKEEIAMLYNEVRGWKIVHARVESRLMEAEAMLGVTASFIGGYGGLTAGKDRLITGKHGGKVTEMTDKQCGCARCISEANLTQEGLPVTACFMIVCPICGNKRCPHATDHRNKCTNSNAPGQPGSRY